MYYEDTNVHTILNYTAVIPYCIESERRNRAFELSSSYNYYKLSNLSSSLKALKCQGVIRNCKLKDRKCSSQTENCKRTNYDLQNITQKTKDGATGTPVKTGSELRCLFKFDNTRLYRILYIYVFLLFIFLW